MPYRWNRVLYIFISIGFISGCSRNPLVYRTGANYLPIENAGSKWIFETEDGRILTMETGGKTTKDDRDCYIIENNYRTEYWYKTTGELSKYVTHTIQYGGEDFLLTERWMKHLELPLILGNCWEDSFEIEKTILGEKIRRTLKSRGEIEEIEDLVVPAGRFMECYKVKTEIIIADSSEFFPSFSDTSIVYEWYGPNIGIVKKIEDGETQNLIEFEIK